MITQKAQNGAGGEGRVSRNLAIAIKNNGELERSSVQNLDSHSDIVEKDIPHVESKQELTELQEDILREKAVVERRLRKLAIRDRNNKAHFPPNFIRTTRYTIISFLPLSILNQYKRLANVYFLMLSVLSCIPIIAPWSPVSMITPTIFVLGVAVLRDGIEDYFRYKADQKSNGQMVMRVECDENCKVVVREVSSADVSVGDIMWIREEDDLPADVVFLGGGIVQHDGGQPECFVQTSSLDGEKNLKKKAAPKGLRLPIQSDGSSRSLTKQLFPQVHGLLYCDMPNKFLHDFNGTLMFKQTEGGKVKKYNLTEAQLLLKGSKLMNTPDGIIGVVVYTGHDTKMMQNQNKQRFKQSNVEQQMNKNVSCMFVFVLGACIVLSLCSFLWNKYDAGGENAWYLYYDKKLSDSGFFNAVISFFSNMILFGTFIPVSLIVTVEVSKAIQGWFISNDIEMTKIEYELMPPKSTEKAQPIDFQCARVNTSMLNEELGQVRYVFSDKTGTLTQNMMEFRQCKIGNFVYGDQNKDEPEPEVLQSSIEMALNEQQGRLSANGFHSLNKMADQKQDEEFKREISVGQLSQSSRRSVRSNINSKQGASYNYVNMQLESLLFDIHGDYQKINTKFESISGQSIIKFVTQKKMAEEFLQSLAINHDCMPNTRKDDEDDSAPLTYQGSSPDEVALLEFAQKHGYEFLAGTDEELRVAKKHKVSGSVILEGLHKTSSLDAWRNLCDLSFKLVRKMEFNSDRKRMSVIVRDDADGLYKMYVKGADSIIKERLHESYFRVSPNFQYDVDNESDVDSLAAMEAEVNQMTGGSISQLDIHMPGNQMSKKKEILVDTPSSPEAKMLDETNQFLLEASRSGYRTLLVGMRVLDEQEVHEFLKEVDAAEADINQRAKLLDELYDKWERDLQLIGATVLEDRLQDQVPETIQAMHEADIKVWVLTGDKLETAESIGFSSKLLTADMDIVRCRTHADILEQFNQKKAETNEIAIQLGKKRAIIIEAEALKYVLKVNYAADDGEAMYDEVTRWFLKIARSVETVICCRVSPSQKAEVVRIVKQDDPEIITLSIGDGANDVPMIMEADIGIGLFGKEGMRAVDSSDIAISQFRFLWQLLFKWGRWNYYRTATLINYFFYKNFSYTMLQVMFSTMNGFSSQSLFPDNYLSLFNLFFTSAPISQYSIADNDFYPSSEKQVQEDAPDDDGDEEELTHLEAYDAAHWRKFIPKLYFPGQRNLLFNNYVFVIWILQALFECLFIFFFTSAAFSNGIITSSDGEPGDIWMFGMTCFNGLNFVVHARAFFLIKKYDLPMVVLFLFFSVALYIYYNWQTDFWVTWDTGHFTFHMLWTRPLFYLVLMFEFGVVFLIDWLIEFYLQVSYGDTRDVMRRQILLHDGVVSKRFQRVFDSKTNMLKQLAIEEDEMREDELDRQRMLNTGITQEQQPLNESRTSAAGDSALVSSRQLRSFVQRWASRAPTIKVDDMDQIQTQVVTPEREPPVIELKQRNAIPIRELATTDNAMTPQLRRVDASDDKVAQSTAARMSYNYTGQSPIVEEGHIMRPNMGTSHEEIIDSELMHFEKEEKNMREDLENTAEHVDPNNLEQLQSRFQTPDHSRNIRITQANSTKSRISDGIGLSSINEIPSGLFRVHQDKNKMSNQKNSNY